MGTSGARRMKELIEAILDPSNWKPNISKIANETGVPPTTVSDAIKKRQKNCQLEVTIRNLSEAEALERCKNDE